MSNLLTPLKSRLNRGTTIDVLVKDKLVSFAYPMYPLDGPRAYKSTLESVLTAGLKIPTGEEMAGLLYTLFNEMPKERETRSIRDSLEGRQNIIIPNINIWTSEGMFVVYDQDGLELDRNTEISELTKSLDGGSTINEVKFSKDGNIRFVPADRYSTNIYTIKEGKMAPNPTRFISSDGFGIAQFGVEGYELVKKLKIVEQDYRFSLVYGMEKHRWGRRHITSLNGDGTIWGSFTEPNARLYSAFGVIPS